MSKTAFRSPIATTLLTCFLIIAPMAFAQRGGAPAPLKGKTTLSVVNDPAAQTVDPPSGTFIAYNGPSTPVTFKIVSDGFSAAQKDYVLQFKITPENVVFGLFPLGSKDDVCTGWKLGDYSKTIKVAPSSVGNLHQEATFTEDILPMQIVKAVHPASTAPKYRVAVRVVPVAWNTKTVMNVADPASVLQAANCAAAPSNFVAFWVPGSVTQSQGVK